MPPIFQEETFEFLPKPGKSSFLRKQESSPFKTFWITAYAGMTKWGYFSKVSVHVFLIADGRRDMQTLLQRRLLDA